MPPSLPSLPAGIKLDIEDPKALEDPAVLQMISEFLEGLDANPLLGFFPHPKQQAFMAAKVRTKVFLGGVRSGKTSAGVVNDIIQAVDAEVVPDHLKRYKIWEPPFKCRIVTPDYGLSFRAVIETAEKWAPPAQLRGGGWEKAFRDKDHILYFGNGSMIEFMTLEQEVNKFGGSARHRVHFDEEPKGERGEEIVWQCQGRLADYRGDELYTFSPIHGLTWTYDELWEKKGPEIAEEVWQDESSVLVKARIHDNPHIDEQGRLEYLAKLPEGVREAYESGNFIHFEGLVYENFDEDIHVVPKMSQADVKKLVQFDVIDPGMQTTAVLFAGYDDIEEDGKRWPVLRIYDELALSGPTAIPETAAERIFNKRQSWGLKQHPKYCLIDPAARSRDLATGERVDMAYRRAGVKVLPAQNEVEAGVFEVMRRMEHRDSEGNPKPLILIGENCKHLIRELHRYRLKPKEDGTFGVVKKQDHFCDCTRYLCLARPMSPKERGPNRPKRDFWVPGTAPVHRATPKQYGPLGKYA